jgi:hypothetical protein
MSLIRRHPQIIAYLILVLLAAGALFEMQSNADQDRQRAYEGGIALCQTNYDLRLSVLKFIDTQTTQTPPPPDASPAVKEQSEVNNRRRAELREEARKAFVFPPACVLDLNLKIAEDGKTLVPA